MHTRTLLLLLGIMAGIIFGFRFSYGSEVAVMSVLLSSLQILLHSFSQRKVLLASRKPLTIPLISGIVFLSFGIGIIRTQFIEEKNSFVCERTCSFEGVVTSSPEVKSSYQSFRVRPDMEGDVYDVLVRTTLYPRVVVGDRVGLTGVVRVPPPMKDHTGEKTFDYISYLHLHSVGSEMFYPEVNHRGSGHVTFFQRLERLKEACISLLDTYVDQPASSLASGMLFGNVSMSQESVNTFRATGLSHIVVLSGFNIAILVGFILFVFSFLPLLVRVTMAVVIVCLFVVMTGAEASIIRASIMALIALTALSFGKGYVARQALLVSLLLIVMYDPAHLLYDVSLHLSFLATAGIVYLGDRVHILLRGISSPMYREMLTTTLVAYSATLPYVMYTFGTLSLYAILANILVLPLVPLMMLISFFIIIVAPFSHVLTLPLGYFATLLGDVIFFIAETLEKFPFASLTVSVSLPFTLSVYCFLIVIFLFFIRQRQERLEDETYVTENEEIVSGVLRY